MVQLCNSIKNAINTHNIGYSKCGLKCYVEVITLNRQVWNRKVKCLEWLPWPSPRTKKAEIMKKQGIISMIVFITIVGSCNNDPARTNEDFQPDDKNEISLDTVTKHFRVFNAELPTIGLLMYNGVLQSEVIATSDVFSKLSEDGKRVFNVIARYISASRSLPSKL